MLGNFGVSIGLALALAAGMAPAIARDAIGDTPETAAVPADPTITTALVAALADRLESDFVLPGAGRRYAAMLRANLASDRYATLADEAEVARTLTEDLRAIHHDAHLRVREPRDQPLRPTVRPRSDPIERANWLADGVAYIRFTVFPGDDRTLAALRAFLETHADAATLIFDLRAHRGGGLAEMEVIFPYLFGEETELVRMDTRAAVEQVGRGVFEDGPTLRRVDGPADVVRRAHIALPGPSTGLRDARVILLTSPSTASAAEHFALALKRTGRATLIGETTSGAGNYGYPADLPGGYTAFIPMGRTFDPDTDRGWEGVGVEPDVVAPAEQALIVALERAGLSSAQARALGAPPAS